METSRWQDTGEVSPGDTHTDMHTGRAVLTVGCGLYLAPGLHPPVLAGLRVTALAQRGRKAGQRLAVERPQAPVVPALLTLNLPDLEAAAAVPGTLCGEQEERGDLSPWRFHRALGLAVTRRLGFLSREVFSLTRCREGVPQAAPRDRAPEC